MTTPDVVTSCQEFFLSLSWLGPFTEWLRNAAIIAGVWVGTKQLSVWRSEHLSKRKAEVAEKLLSRASDAKLAFSSVRSAMENVPEGVEDQKKYIVEMKWQRLADQNEKFDSLRELQILHEALVGDEEVRNAVNELFDVRQEIYAALATLAQTNWSRSRDPSTSELYDGLDRVIYAMGSEEYDKLTPRINDALGRLREKLLPQIRMLRS